MYLCNTYLTKILSNKNLAANKIINNYYQLIQESKTKNKRLLTQCITEIMPIKNIIYTHDNYIMYTIDYELLTNIINYDDSLGEKLKKKQRIQM